MSSLKLVSSAEASQIYASHRETHLEQYWGFFSSWLGGICFDPAWMLVPLDDHMVHRGDGVFEAIKVTNAGIYLLKPHLQRLMKSASRIDLKLPWSEEHLEKIILGTAKAVLEHKKVKEALVRVFLSRGPGSFSPSPFDSVGTQLFVVVTALGRKDPRKYDVGVSTGRSYVPVKPAWFAQVKSCNYLPNVMMKKEAMDRGIDYSIGFDENNFVSEGPTENIIIVNREGKLQRPNLDHMLQGTTMTRLLDLADEHKLMPVKRGGNLTEQDLMSCQGAFMVGTTLDVLPIASYEGQAIPRSGQTTALQELLKQDQLPGSPWLTML